MDEQAARKLKHMLGDILQVLLGKVLSVYVGAEVRWQLAVCLMVAALQVQLNNKGC